MKELSASESSYHKGRAGTAYSVANRLLKFGFLMEVNEAESRNVQVTEEGLCAVQSWLKPPIPWGDVTHTADLIRLRCFFLGAVDPETQLSMVNDALSSLDAFLDRTEALLLENEVIGEPFGALATVSIILETKSRIEWLKIVRELIEAPDVAQGYGSRLLDRVRKISAP
ncbi:MAG: hypothetical protein MUC92_12490 [Fimbriimonadaceae bacterium]|nr:hypothetical protein [Fimbriimonadaceae bacterium]